MLQKLILFTCIIEFAIISRVFDLVSKSKTEFILYDCYVQMNGVDFIMQNKSDSSIRDKKNILIGVIAGLVVITIIIVLCLRGCDSEISGSPTPSSVASAETSTPTATDLISDTTLEPTATLEATATLEQPTATLEATSTPTTVVTATVKPTVTVKPTQKPTPVPTPTPTATISVNVPPLSTQVGDVVKFGKYEQDNDVSNGKEDIEWIVLAKENNRILVISKYSLDCQKYNTSYVDVTWETCSLRSWLNNDFISSAFSSAEISKIPTVTVTADENPNYSSDAGNDTQDKVFLLSLPEVKEYFTSSNERICYPTKYAIEQGAKTNLNQSWWWLRSAGSIQNSAAYIDYEGDIYYGGRRVDSDSVSVRPVLWIDLNP